jgi:hypothetical protein
MDCPFEGCGYSGTRMSLHSHLVDEHADAVEQVNEKTYVLTCPAVDEEITVNAEAGVEDDTLERFSKELTVLAFDKLLNRIE